MSNENTSKLVNPVEMADGSVVDFGKNGQLKREFIFGDNGSFTLKLFLITGKIFEQTIDATNAAYALLAARGAAEYVSNSIAGVYQDKEGKHPEDFELGVEQALKQLGEGELSTRRASEDLKGYGDLIRAVQETRRNYIDTTTNTRKFTDEECSYEVVKAVILSSDETVNKARMQNQAIKALIEGYKLARQEERKAKADKKAEGAIADLADLL